ncbi:GSCOCG00010024001-RA-CDS [Cotesia congregata]|nr:GSCOCG00010024001-RA-CDS [Cotesia congregata]
MCRSVCFVLKMLKLSSSECSQLSSIYQPIASNCRNGKCSSVVSHGRPVQVSFLL